MAVPGKSPPTSAIAQSILLIPHSYSRAQSLASIGLPACDERRIQRASRAVHRALPRMNEPEPPDLERTLPARPSRPSNQDPLESADLERTMPARHPGLSDEPGIADLEKTFVPQGSSRPPSPPTPPPVPQSATSPERPPDSLIPPTPQ